MPFKRQFATQTVASFVAFAVSLGLTPLMTRVFPPASYGAFAIVNGIAVFLATLFQLSMPSMIPLSRTHSGLLRLVRASVYLGALAIVASVGLALCWLVFEFVGESSADQIPASAILMLPFIVASICIQRIAQNIAIARNRFTGLATSRILHPLVAKVLAISAGFATSATGAMLVAAEAVGNFVQAWWTYRGDKLQILRLPGLGTLRRLRVTLELARRAAHFSVYDNLNNLLNLGVVTAVLLIISAKFSASEAGAFSLAMGIVNLPVQLISLATASLVYKRLIGIFEESPNGALGSVLKLITAYGLLGTLPFAVLALFGPKLFTLAFGSAWESSGEIAVALSLPTYLLFIFTPVQAVFRLTRSTKVGFVIDVIFTLLILVILAWSVDGHDFSRAVIALSLALALQRIVQLLAVVRLAATYPYLDASKSRI